MQKLNVNEIFASINGEVNRWGQGSPTVFIRLQGCNLSCSYCFGVLPGRRIPRIILPCDSNKKIYDIKKGDKLLTFDENKELVETTVIDIHRREVNEWLRIKINNKDYFVTPEHPFFTSRGLIDAQNLKIGDMILHGKFQDKLSHKMKNNNPMKNPEVVGRSTQNTDYKIGYNFWNEHRKDEKKLVIRNGYAVQKITKFNRFDSKYYNSTRPEPLKVYNFTCSPYDTYLVDYMWVHNCDTHYANVGLRWDVYSIDDLLAKIKSFGIKRVTITGGEPLLQTNVFILIKRLNFAGYQVSIETNGTMGIPEDLLSWRNICWIVDYKTEFPEQMIGENYLKLQRTDYIKFVINNEEDFKNALLIKEDMQDKGAKGQFAFSPAGADPALASNIVDWLIEQKIDDVLVNLQIHKIISVK